MAVSLLEDGTRRRRPEARGAVRDVATTYDIAVDRATRAELDGARRRGDQELDDLTVAVAGTQDDTLSLTELGFDDLVPVTSAGARPPTRRLLDDVDVLWVGSALTFTPAQARRPGRGAGVRRLRRSIVGAGAPAFTAASGFGLVSGTRVAGNGPATGSSTSTRRTGRCSRRTSRTTSFIYPASAFTGLGAGTTTEQSYDAADPFLAGHWLPGNGGVGPAGGRRAGVRHLRRVGDRARRGSSSARRSSSAPTSRAGRARPPGRCSGPVRTPRGCRLRDPMSHHGDRPDPPPALRRARPRGARRRGRAVRLAAGRRRRGGPVRGPQPGQGRRRDPPPRARDRTLGTRPPHPGRAGGRDRLHLRRALRDVLRRPRVGRARPHRVRRLLRPAHRVAAGVGRRRLAGACRCRSGRSRPAYPSTGRRPSWRTRCASCTTGGLHQAP